MLRAQTLVVGRAAIVVLGFGGRRLARSVGVRNEQEASEDAAFEHGAGNFGTEIEMW